MPTVSVIVPNHNHGAYLAQRIDSILDQTFQDFELILLDDHSSDNSREVIERYRTNPKVAAIYYNDFNTGSPFRQWERGVGTAKGEWVWIAESDDYSSSHFLEAMLGAVGRAENVGLAYCDSYRVVGDIVQQETFAESKNRTFGTDRWSHPYFNEGRNEIESFLMDWGTINNTSAVLFHRETLIKACPFDRSFRYIGDKYSFIKVLSISNVVYVPQPMNYYRAAPNGAPKHSAGFIDYAFEQFHIFDWIFRNMPEVDQDSFRKAFLRNTESSLVTGWNKRKWTMFKIMRRQNSRLFLLHLKHNLKRSFSRVLDLGRFA